MIFRAAAVATILALGLVLGACTMRPVHAPGGPLDQMTLAFQYAEPTNNLERIIIQELALRFYMDDDARTPTVQVRASASHSGQTLSSNSEAFGRNGRNNSEATVSATATVVLDGEVLFTATRQASAEYTTGSQALANQETRIDAEQRAARSVAESLRLALMADFSRSQYPAPNTL